VTAPVQSAATSPIEPVEASTPPSPQVKMFPGKPVRRLGLIVDDSLDIPTFKRRAEEAGFSGPLKLEPNQLVEDDNLDIPTFLRKHAD